MRASLNLPDRDQGIDLIAKTKTGAFWAVQCKYRSSAEHSLTWREISTFAGLTFGVCKGVEFGLIAYTGERYAKVLDGARHIAFLSSDIWSTLDETFFYRLAGDLKGTSEPLTPFAPRPHQKRAIDNAKTYFADPKNTRGKLIMPCGAGKSLTGYWIADALGAQTIVVAVPSLGLIQQTLPVWLREYAANSRDTALRWLCVCSDQTVTKEADSVEIHTQDLGYPCLTNKDDIKAWLEETKDATPRVIFTTYQSGKVLAEAMRESGVGADLGILDEAHKTVGQKQKLFSHLLFDENLPMKRRVFMTATERRYAGQGDDIISMDDPEMYGETFELLSFKEGLEQDPPILSDYKIITMVISHDEIAKLVDENRYVLPRGGAWSDEIEAQMLASMVALRKAMQKFPIKHAVSFHSSIGRSRDFRNFNDIYTAVHTQAGALETYHVTGATPAGERKKTIREFASATRALITNARCLTEGIDVPNIDCVLFADPKQSTVDIVQAVGRALRPAKGKEFGYVIVPVISRGESADEFIESTAFAPVLTVLRSLAANDERIVEYFRAIHSGRRPKGGIIEIDIDEKIAGTIDLNSFEEKIETRVWSRLARLSWRPYEQAIEFVHTLRLKTQGEWDEYCAGKFPLLPQKPADIPAQPGAVYPMFREYGGIGAWLGTGNIATFNRIYKPYDEAVEFVHSLKLKTQEEWRAYCRGEHPDLPQKPADIPANPSTVYNKEFKNRGGYRGWLRAGIYIGPWLAYDQAVRFVRALKLQNRSEWVAYCRGEKPFLPVKPHNIPDHPDYYYGEEFIDHGGYGGWLATGRHRGGWLPYEEAAAFVRALQLKTQEEWRAYCRGARPDLPPKPIDIPIAPAIVYGDEFKRKGKIGAWLGTARRHPRDLIFKSYDEARPFVHSLGLKSQNEWNVYCKGLRPDLPAKPADVAMSAAKHYGAEFKNKGGWRGWLGTKGRVLGSRSRDTGFQPSASGSHP